MELTDANSIAELAKKGTGRNSLKRGSCNLIIRILMNPGYLVAPLVGASIVASLVSVAASGMLLGLGFIAWIADCVVNKRIIISSPPFKWYLLAFLLFTVLSALFSQEPLSDIARLKSYLKFIIPFLLMAYMTVPQIKKSLLWIFLVSGASMFCGFAQFFFGDGVDLLHRIDGFMSHWMTYSGQIMMVFVASIACGIFLLKSKKTGQRLSSLPWFALSVLLAANLVLTYTRSAWLGALGGLITVTVLTLRTRWLLVLGAAVVLIFVMMPSTVHQRLLSGFDLNDTTTRGRLDIWRSGITVALKNPVVGVGFSSAPRESLKYRKEKDLAEWAYQHSHNNLIQVAATSGIPALLAWIALWLKIIFDHFRILLRNRPNKDPAVLAAAAISILAAFHLMGLMEFNFGDSEVMTLLLFFITIPYIASKRPDAADGA